MGNVAEVLTETTVFRTSVAGQIATLTLSSPPVNALSEVWISGLSREIARLEARDDWKVLHLRSDQKVFCAGADLKEMHVRFDAPDGPDRTFAYVASIQRLYARIESLPRVTFAEIGGAALGGGFSLRSPAIQIAPPAKLAPSELGLIPGIMQRLTGVGLALPIDGPRRRSRRRTTAERLGLCNGPVRGRNSRTAQPRSSGGSPHYRRLRSRPRSGAWHRRHHPAAAAMATNWN
jgi:hypothetical protein